MEERARYDWMGYIGNFIGVGALIPLPFAGYYLGREIYSYNEQMGITPVGVQKRIKDIIEGVYDPDEAKKEQRAAHAKARYDAMPEKDLERELKQLEKQMQDAARNLEFEKAAELRDRLFELREKLFGVSLPVET